MKRKFNKKAFTLVELLVVIAILAILATVSVVGYTAFIKNAHISNDQKLTDELSRVLEAHLVEGTINSEAELKEAIIKYTGSEDFAFKPESAEYGYHYWYDIKDKKIVLVKSEELISSAGFRPLFLAHAEGEGTSAENTFAPNSFRVFTADDGKLYYLLDRVNEHSDTIKFIQYLENADMTADQYREIINNTSSKDGLVTYLKTNLAKIAIVNSTGMHVVGDGTEVKYVYIPTPAKDDADGYTLGSTGSVALPNVKAPIVLPEGVKVGTDSLNNIGAAGTGNLKEGATEIHVNLTEAQLKDYFFASSTTCVIVLPNGDRYIVNGTEIVKLTAEGGTSIGGTEYSAPVTSFDIICDEDEGSDKLLVENGFLYVAYDYEGNLTLKGDNFNNGESVSSEELTWEITNSNNDMLVPNGDGTYKIAAIPEVGDEGNYTATIKATATAGGHSEEIKVYVVRPIDLDLTLAGTNLDKDSTSITLTYTGDSYDYKFDSIDPKDIVVMNMYNKVECNTDVVIDDGTTNNLFTINGDTLTLESLNNYTDVSQTFTVKVGTELDDVTASINVKVNDTSAKPYQLKDGINGSMLYRIGNANGFTLDKFFESEKAPANFTLTISSVKNGVTATYGGEAGTSWTCSSDKLSTNKLQFTGSGALAIRIDNGTPLFVEVVNGTNITSYSEWPSSGNIIFLNDITMSSGSSKALSSQTLYGNNFKFNVQEGRVGITATGDSSMYVIKLVDSILDNVQIIGKPFNTFDKSSTGTNRYYNIATVLTDGNSIIANSYISNFAAPVRLGNGDLLLLNTTLSGGSFANLDIRNGHVIIDNVTTINQQSVNGKSDIDAGGSVGFGIVTWYESVVSASITLRGNLTPYNNVTKADVQSSDFEYASQLASSMFGSENAKFQYTDSNGVVWINTGILSLNKSLVGEEDIITTDFENSSKYIGATVSMSTYSGYLYGLASANVADALKNPSEYVSAGQYEIQPDHAFDNSKNQVAQVAGNDNFCTIDGTTITVSFDDGGSKVFDLDGLFKPSKNGSSIAITQINHNGKVIYEGEGTIPTLTFDESGTHAIEFHYVDTFNYSIDGTNIKTISKDGSATITINVKEVAKTAKNAEFTFYGYSSISKTSSAEFTGEQLKTVTDSNENIWIMPNTTGSYVVSTTINEITVNCPVVYVDFKDNSSDFNWLYPVFLGVQIDDYADGGTGDKSTVVSPSSTSKPANLTIITEDKYDDSRKGWSSGSGKTGSEGKISSGTYNGLYGWIGGPLGSDQTSATTFYGQFKYVDNKGATYYYAIAFKREAHECPESCVAEGTLITLADGTKKPVEELTPNDVLLVFNHETGKLEYRNLIFTAHKDQSEALRRVINLEFSNGNLLRIVASHGLYDLTLNQYVYIDEQNVNNYIGHKFYSTNYNGAEFIGEIVTLNNSYITEETVKVYSPVSVETMNCFANDILTVTPLIPGVEGLVNYFEYDENMKYDEEMMKADIEKYGLYTYEEFADYYTYEQFMNTNSQYFKIAVGKGYLTWEHIEMMLKYITAEGLLEQ